MSMAQQWIILRAMSMDTLMTIHMNIHIHMNSCQTLDCGQRETNWSIEQIGNSVHSLLVLVALWGRAKLLWSWLFVGI